MILEQLQLLLSLYVRPVRAASRIIDHGRLWFALCSALLVLLAVRGGVFLPDKPVLKIVGAMALAFVPVVILVMTVYRSHESFPVMLRKDYLTFLNCVLLSLAAALLPLAVLSRIVLPVYLALALVAAAGIYFLILVTFCIRTLWGSGLAVAGGAALVGLAATFGGLIAFLALGSFMYYLSSPFVLFYAYILLGSDMRSLGEGLRARQHLRRQLDIAATNPRDADAHYQIGLIYQQRHQYDEAKKRFARAVEIDAKEADPVFQLGRIALEEDRLDDAIELFRRAAALDDKCCSHEVWRDLGVAYLRSARLEDARLVLSKFVERRSYDPEGLYWYGKSLVGLGELDNARQQFEQCREAVDTMPSNRRRQLSKWKRLTVSELKSL
jgi:tetratricopeptide (TPR) repeat protein